MDSIFAAVSSGKADFGGTLTQTPERSAACDFSYTVMPTTISVIVESKDGAARDESLFASLSSSFRKTFIEESRWKLILSGLGVTVLISVCAGSFGLLLGYVTVLARRSGIRWVGKLVDGYQALMGGIPLVVVLMVLYYVVFGSLNVAGEIVAIIAFTLAFGSTAGSTMWTAVDGIDVIQEETGLALGYTRKAVFHKIIFPQARQQFTPQLMGQFVSLVKDTAIVGYIAVQDLTRAGDLIRARTMDAFFPLISIALVYFLFCRLLAWLLRKVAANLDVTNHPRKIEGVVEQ
jgi:polar amino acid transport system substrate-binding protein